MNVRLTQTFAGLVLATLTGCSQLAYDPSPDHNTLATTEFIHSLAQQPLVNYDQVCRVALILADGDDTRNSFEERESELLERGVVRQEWKLGRDFVVDRGTFAYMIYKTCKMPGGLNVRLAELTGFGDRRYALKEVVRRKVIPYGLPYQLPTGGEIVMAMGKADDYMAKHGMYDSAEVEINSPEDVPNRGAPGP